MDLKDWDQDPRIDAFLEAAREKAEEMHNDTRANETLVAGMLFASLSHQRDTDGSPIFEVEIPMDEEGQAMPGVLFRVPRVMKSQYLITVVMRPETNNE